MVLEIKSTKLINKETGEVLMDTTGSTYKRIEEEILKPIEVDDKEITNKDAFIFMKSDNNVARCHKLEPFDVFEIYDREWAFEQAKKMQDSGQDISVVLASNGKVYIQILTENNLFLHI